MPRDVLKILKSDRANITRDKSDNWSLFVKKLCVGHLVYPWIEPKSWTIRAAFSEPKLEVELKTVNPARDYASEIDSKKLGRCQSRTVDFQFWGYVGRTVTNVASVSGDRMCPRACSCHQGKVVIYRSAIDNVMNTTLLLIVCDASNDSV